MTIFTFATRSERQQVPVTGSKLQRIERLDRVAVILREPDANPDHLFRSLDLARNVARQEIRKLAGHRLRRNILERCIRPIDLDLERVTREDDTVLDANDTLDLGDCACDLRAESQQLFADHSRTA